MFTKKKVLILIVIMIFVGILDFWVFSTVKNSFRATVEENQEQMISLITDTAPQSEEKIDDWLSVTNNKYEDFEVMYIYGVPGIDDLKLYYPEDSLKDFYEKIKETQDYQTGLDNAYYLEKYFAENNYDYKNSMVELIFSPVVDESGYDINGVLVFLATENQYTNFANLMNIFMIGVFFIAFIVIFISNFFRDPVMGFVILALFIIVGIFVAYPLFEALRLTFLKDGKFSLETWKTILTNKQYLRALWGSIRLGTLTATFSTIVGFIFAFAVNRMKVKGKKFISTMGLLPVISPPFSLTLSIILLFGNNGLITKQLFGITNFSIYGLGGLTLVQTISMFPIAYLTLSGVLGAIDSTLEDAALDLNAGKFKTFTTVTFPLAIPGILSAWLLVFTNSLADFANPLLLAGSYRVLSVEAYIEVTGLNRLGNGAALSILLLLPTMTAFLVQRFWVSKKSYVTVTGKPSTRVSELASKPVKITLMAFISIFILFIIGLYGTIVAGCFVENWGIDYSFTLSNITEALQRGSKAITDTFTLAAVATPIAGILAMIAALVVVRKKFVGKRALESLILTPFAVPGTLIGISYILAFNKAPIILVGTGLIIIINYVIRELPVGVEGGVATLRQIDPSIEEAAQDLGADMPTVFKTVVLPLIRPAFISSMSYTFVRSMTAVSAIIFLISARWYHMTVLIYNFSENLRFGLASVLATTLIIIVLSVFGLLRLFVKKSENLEKNFNA